MQFGREQHIPDDRVEVTKGNGLTWNPLTVSSKEMSAFAYPP